MRSKLPKASAALVRASSAPIKAMNADLASPKIHQVVGPFVLKRAVPEAEALRLAAVWNACEGIPTEALEAGVIAEVIEALRRALEWIDAVPSDTRLPAMPGFDRDDVDELLDKLEKNDG